MWICTKISMKSSMHTIQNRTYSSDIFVLFDLAAINAHSLLVDVFSFVLLFHVIFFYFRVIRRLHCLNRVIRKWYSVSQISRKFLSSINTWNVKYEIRLYFAVRFHDFQTHRIIWRKSIDFAQFSHIISQKHTICW